MSTYVFDPNRPASVAVHNRFLCPMPDLPANCVSRAACVPAMTTSSASPRQQPQPEQQSSTYSSASPSPNPSPPPLWKGSANLRPHPPPPSPPRPPPTSRDRVSSPDRVNRGGIAELAAQPSSGFSLVTVLVIALLSAVASGLLVSLRHLKYSTPCFMRQRSYSGVAGAESQLRSLATRGHSPAVVGTMRCPAYHVW